MKWKFVCQIETQNKKISVQSLMKYGCVKTEIYGIKLNILFKMHFTKADKFGSTVLPKKS